MISNVLNEYMHKFLSSGNRTRGQADGFGLEILPKLKDVKTSVSNFVSPFPKAEFDKGTIQSVRKYDPIHFMLLNNFSGTWTKGTASFCYSPDMGLSIVHFALKLEIVNKNACHIIHFLSSSLFSSVQTLLEV